MAIRPLMVVTFHKVVKHDTHCWWEARRARGGRITGGRGPVGRGVIPHDLVHLVTEAELGLEFGFWGLLERGATFRRGVDRRPTRPGRALVAAHRGHLAECENVGNIHHHAWVHGHPTHLRNSFDRLAELWTPLPNNGTLTVEWPSLIATSSQSDQLDPVALMEARRVARR